MGHYNRKATDAEMAKAHAAIQAAYPDCEVIFGCHGNYGGHRAPRDHTLAFRLRDARGKYRSNVVWLMPDWLAKLTPEKVRRLVDAANGQGKPSPTPRRRLPGA